MFRFDPRREGGIGFAIYLRSWHRCRGRYTGNNHFRMGHCATDADGAFEKVQVDRARRELALVRCYYLTLGYTASTAGQWRSL